MRAKLDKIQSQRGFVALCRPGFERELVKELARLSLGAVVEAESGSGFVALAAERPMARDLSWRDLIFARQIWPWGAKLEHLPVGDRLGPILAALANRPFAGRYRGAVLEFPDSEAGRPLARLCRSFAKPLAEALRAAGHLTDEAPWELRLLFTASTIVWLGEVPCGLACPWPGGIIRLKLPVQAPSRAVLKLVEALKVFLSEEERARWLKPAMSAVDLGAAPGGWSWQLAKWGLQVVAVLATGLVEHVAADGFKWRPTEAVDWLLCDMIARPQQVIELICQWLARRLCRQALFNLKLPMQNRLEMVEATAKRLGQSAKVVRIKHLYHDREEVTVYARIE